MDISKLKEFLQKLSFLKDYSSLMVPAIIMLAALILFIPSKFMRGKLEKKIASETVSMGKKVQALSKNVISVNQWEKERDYQQAYENDANQIALLARQTTQRELLSYKIFPKPSDTSMLIFQEFGRQFYDSIDKLIARENARDCPTAGEIERSLRGSSGSKRGGSFQDSKEVSVTIKEVLCREKAEAASFYLNPADLAGYEFWENYEYSGMNEAIEDCWYYQLAYWIMEDVIDTASALNAGSKSVFTSPVKRIMSVNFKPRKGEARDKLGKKNEDRPAYVLSNENMFTESCTGRLCNDDIDVVHFNVGIVIDSRAVLQFMRQLCSAKEHKFRGFSGDAPEQILKHNQITILESKIVSIDQNSEVHALYRYGDDAVVQLDLVCEYVFNKKGYDEIKPKLVKKSQKPGEGQEGEEEEVEGEGQ